MKQSMKESLMNGLVGKIVIATVTLGIAVMGFKVVQPEISSENRDILVLVIVLFFVFLMVLLPIVPALLFEKMLAGITKQKNTEDAELKKAELENEKIRLQNEQLALQNKQFELQKENQQSPPEE